MKDAEFEIYCNDEKQKMLLKRYLRRYIIGRDYIDNNNNLNITILYYYKNRTLGNRIQLLRDYLRKRNINYLWK